MQDIASAFHQCQEYSFKRLKFRNMQTLRDDKRCWDTGRASGGDEISILLATGWATALHGTETVRTIRQASNLHSWSNRGPLNITSLQLPLPLPLLPTPPPTTPTTTTTNDHSYYHSITATTYLPTYHLPTYHLPTYLPLLLRLLLLLLLLLLLPPHSSMVPAVRFLQHLHFMQQTPLELLKAK